MAPGYWLKWREEILHGVNSVRKIGVPGTIIAFGENAVPILTGDKVHELILTASQSGKGRIVVFSHTGYIVGGFFKVADDFKKLSANIKKWATNGSYSNENEVLYITQNTPIDDINNGGYLLFVWDGEERDQEFVATMLNNVKEKGIGLVMGKCPWGWRQLNHERPLEEAWFHPVLIQAGVCYTSDYVGKSGKDGNTFHVEGNKADEAHLGRVVTQFSEDPHASTQSGQLLQHALPNLPEDAWRALSSAFTKMLVNLKPVQQIPTPQNPVSGHVEKMLLNIQLREVQSTAKEGMSLPGSEIFPGSLLDSNSLVGRDANLEIIAAFNSERHSTGYYIPAGWKLMVKVIKGDISNWTLRVGAHSDELHSTKEWRRWPIVTSTKPLKKDYTELVSPFGGLVYLENHKKGTLEVKLLNVIEAPFYDLTDPLLCSTWYKRRHAPGLWADLASEHIIFTLPSSSVRGLENPAEVLRLWDKVVCAHHHLKGTDPLKRRRERVVCDEQPSCGYMHSGYPIVTHLDVTDVHSWEFLMNPAHLREEGSWGMYHELGHNMQEDAWTFSGTGEVTCNIFTLHAMQVVSGQKPWIHSWLQSKTKGARDYISRGASFKEWQGNPGVALFFYAQLINSFGWESFKVVFRKYRDESLKPSTNQEKIDQWFLTFSDVVSYNLLPMAKFWGIPISESISGRVEASGLRPFLPDDEITAFDAAGRISSIETKYGELTRKSARLDTGRFEFVFDEKAAPSRLSSLKVLSSDGVYMLSAE